MAKSTEIKKNTAKTTKAPKEKTQAEEKSEETKNKIRTFALANPKGVVDEEWRKSHPDFMNNFKIIHSKRELEIVNLLQSKFPEDEWEQGAIYNRPICDVVINPDIHSDKLKIVIQFFYNFF